MWHIDAPILILGGFIVTVCLTMLVVVLVRPPARLRASGRRAQVAWLFATSAMIGVNLALYSAANLGILSITFPLSVWLHFGLGMLTIGALAAALLVYPPYPT